MNAGLAVLLWMLFTVGIVLFMRAASYKDNISRDPYYYDKD